MRKMLRSQGKSVTGTGTVRGTSAFRRGIRRSDEKFRQQSAAAQVEYDLAKFLSSDEKLLMGQIISLLDKTIRKRQSLSKMNPEAYLHRANLGNELQALFLTSLEDNRRRALAEVDRQKLLETWAWRLHPYRGYKQPADGVSPENDENYQRLVRNKEFDPIEEFQGPWYKEFWPNGGKGAARYAEIAGRMWAHLTNQEIKLHNSPRPEADDPEVREGRMIDTLKQSGASTGLSSTRGERISLSVRDPRISRKEKHGMQDGEAWHFRAVEWEKSQSELYFREYTLPHEDGPLEVTQRIYNAIKVRRNEPVRSADFGRMLHEHFKNLEDVSRTWTATDRKRLWALHNHVRAFYQRIAKSNRFRKADRAIGERELVIDAQTRTMVDDREYQLSRVVPRNKTELQDRIRGKRRNADIGELIRLGKLVVHGSDLSLHPDGKALRTLPAEELTRMFNERLDYLVTSDGQSEIKRNEAFNRIWRNAVALSQRTLKNWTEANPKEEGGEDPFDVAASKAAYVKLNEDTKRQHFQKHANVLFGADKVGPKAESRASIVVTEDDKANKEMFWTLLRISSELRNRSNHFCTKERLVDLITGRSDRSEDSEPNDAIVMPMQINDINQRAAHHVCHRSVESLDRLLAFDKHLERRVLADELNAISFNAYCAELLNQYLAEPSDQVRETLLAEICKSPTPSKVTYPKFNSVARIAINLAKNDGAVGSRTSSPLAFLKLDNDDRTQPGANKFQVEVFRMLYHGGFRSWVEEGCPVKTGTGESTERRISQIISDVVDAKKTRTEKTRQDQGWIHAQAETITSLLGFQPADKPFEFLQKLNSESVIEERLNQTYKADPKKQSQVANRVERFRQELTLVMFERYLDEMGLIVISEINEPEELPDKAKLSIDDLAQTSDWQQAHWHSRFYAWLYLVPVEDISSLRLQLMKTRALEEKSFRTADQSPADAIGDVDAELDAALDDLDRLMALYGRVNSAGFDGTEHYEGLKNGDLFYQDSSRFDAAMNADNKSDKLAVAGTRRGLRQMLRFNHTQVLSKIIDRHRVTSEEVDALIGDDASDIRDAFDQRRQVHEQIIEACKRDPNQPDKETDWDAIKGLCADYKNHVATTTLHDFRVSAARLTEFSRLHQMMMRMIGRLADYTLLWERDMIYLFLGSFYREQKEHGAAFEFACEPVKSDMTPGRRGNRAKFRFSAKTAEGQIDVELWGDREGFLGLPFKNEDGLKQYLTQADNRNQFYRYWSGTGGPNPKDEASNALRKQRKQKDRNKLKNAEGYRQIRNDFAHYNMITRKKEFLNLTYQVNAVRSLFGYDRKLKNAVSQSIIRIAQQAGVKLDFMMRDDRLTKARALPVLQTHLTMVPASKVKSGQCSVPRSSIRFTSMVRALFDHDKGGNRDLVNDAKGKSRKGILMYSNALETPDEAPMPTGLRTARLPIYVQKSAK